jgi:hypothetical protein
MLILLWVCCRPFVDSLWSILEGGWRSWLYFVAILRTSQCAFLPFFTLLLRTQVWTFRLDALKDTINLLLHLLYRVSQEECARLQESIPYDKVYRYNPKHPYQNLNGYGDNGQRKVRSSCDSTYCTCSADALRVHCACPFFVCRQLSHAATWVSTCIVLGTLRTTTALMRVFM